MSSGIAYIRLNVVIAEFHSAEKLFPQMSIVQANTRTNQSRMLLRVVETQAEGVEQISAVFHYHFVSNLISQIVNRIISA